MKQTFSDEIINAYLDDQLDKAERGQILEALPLNNELSNRLCKLQKVKDMVQLAYPADPVPQKEQKGFSSGSSRIAAGLLLVAGVLSGWIANGYFTAAPSLTELAQSVQIPNSLAEQKKWRLMLHVNSSDPTKFKTLLDETEQLLMTSAASGKEVSVEILTNGPGLSLLQAGNAEHIQRLQALTHKYDNLALLACEKAIHKLQTKENIKFNLIPEARVVKSALHQVMKRKEEGWSYIRI